MCPFSIHTAIECAPLTHWRRVTHICVNKLTTIVSDNGLSPGRCQAIIWTNAGILLIWPLGNFGEIRNSYIFIQENAIEDVVWKMAAILSRPRCVKCCGMERSRASNISRTLQLSRSGCLLWKQCLPVNKSLCKHHSVIPIYVWNSLGFYDVEFWNYTICFVE